MTKNKCVVLNLLMAVFISGFVSCSEPEPPAFDKGKLIGTYVGECIVSSGLTSENLSFSAEFKQKDKQNLYLSIGNDATYQSVGISALPIASGFKDHGSYARFDLEDIIDTFGSTQIPNFIKTIGPAWDIKNATLKLTADSKNPPRYTLASKSLTFSYTGTIEITGVNTNDYYRSSITYKFNLSKR